MIENLSNRCADLRANLAAGRKATEIAGSEVFNSLGKGVEVSLIEKLPQEAREKLAEIKKAFEGLVTDTVSSSTPYNVEKGAKSIN